MSIIKQYNKKDNLCKVTFKLSEVIFDSATQVNLVGEFNNWELDSMPMNKLKDGDFSISIYLEKGQEYQFKYLIDGWRWVNDPDSDKHVPNGFHSENSVIIV